MTDGRYPPEPRRDPPDEAVTGRCARCRGELYRAACEGLCPACAAEAARKIAGS